MKKLPFLFITICLLSSMSIYGQFVEDFSDDDLTTNPTWTGDLDSFRVNASQELQLDASVAGSSSMYVNYLAEDSLEWIITFTMDFAPSASNALQVFLNLDNTELSTARGYYLDIGESGSNDAIRFYKTDQGTKTQLAEATMGAVGSEPAVAKIRMVYSPDLKLWTLYADYTGGNNLEEEFSIVESSIPISGNRFFGIKCNYTSTRIDKFFFDDISLMTWSAGNAPSLISYDIVAEDSLILHFDKILSDENNQKLDRITHNDQQPLSLKVSPQDPSLIFIKLAQPLSGTMIDQLCAEGITDNGGQASIKECLDIIYITKAKKGELFINEILFNPPFEAEDFVELINVTDRFISLQGLIFSNTYNEQTKMIEEDLVIPPQGIMAFSKSARDIIDYYNPPEPFEIKDQDLPAYNVADGNVWVYYEENGNITTIDSFDYDADMHYALIDDVKGVSLEKISATAQTNDGSSWHSGTEVTGFATPGYQNSNVIDISSQESPIFLDKKIFSPNGDSQDDFLLIGFNLDQPGYIANIKIYNDRGYLVRYLSNNTLLGPESVIKWDGLSDDGIKADIGVYIVLTELFDLDGNTIYSKEVCVLADFLD